MRRLLVLLCYCYYFCASAEGQNGPTSIYGETEENDFYYEQTEATPVETDMHGHPLKLSPKHRTKRSLGQSSRHFSLNSFGENFQLVLDPSRSFLAPGFKVYHRKDFKTVKEEVIDEDQMNCLYVGKSKNHMASSVAVSACGGLTGLIRTSQSDFFIQPVSNHSEVHIVKRRSVRKSNENVQLKKHETKWKQPKEQTHFCGRKRRYMPHKPSKQNHWLPNEFLREDNSTRVKRSVKRDPELPRSVETLVVADRDMVLKHGVENVTTYILTVFNMVAMLYQDSTIGSNISVILVGLVLLEGDEPGLTLSHNAERSLTSFCQWQSTLRTRRGTQHDHAVLVTGKDICSWKEGPCDTLGYAPISGMCSRYRSCTVNEDSGLALAFTVAHEIGHNFGMVHDGQGRSSCNEVRGTIMSPSLSGLDSEFLWSSCSQRDLANFLRSPRALCLNNKPDSVGQQLKFPDALPGQTYDGHTQCMFQFGTKFTLCRHYAMKDEICKALWCENGRKCETKFLPAAEGTVCGKNKWCRKGNCVPQELENVVPVNGKWSNFSEWSSCSVNCALGGLKYREKYCNSPPPKNGGNYCQGSSKEYAICQGENCPSNETQEKPDYCSVFRERTIKGKYYTWSPYNKHLGALARCRIYCSPNTSDLYLVLSAKLPDGTSCQGNYSSVCVDGECRTVGCDGKVDSDVMPDRCGVCNGDGSTCSLVKGTFIASNLSRGYHEVIRIPKGSRHLNVSETKDHPTFLSLRNTQGHFYLNGNWAIHWPGRYMAGDSVISYRRWPGQPESFVTKGPTNEDLVVEVLVQGGQHAIINYSFVVPLSKHTWHFYNSSCSSKCGNGVILSKAKCTDTSGIVVNESLCSRTSMPDTRTYPCYEHCKARWKTTSWSHCTSTSCNQPSWKTRDVYCFLDGETQIPFLCNEEERPQTTRKCPTDKCMGNWKVGPWTPCKGGCSNAIQKRAVSCNRQDKQFSSTDHCDSSIKPPSFRSCYKKECSLKKRHRSIWIEGQWSACSVTCGLGVQVRNVTCSSTRGDVSDCDQKDRPKTSKTCMKISCSSTVNTDCEDHHNWCADIKSTKLCKRPFYYKKCCKSCRNF